MVKIKNGAGLVSRQAIFEEETKIETRKPKLYKVILLNDDYTTQEFVVEVLVAIFHKSVTEATKIMFDVHEKGKGIVGVYTYDIARTKIIQVEDLSNKNEYPLKAVMEEE
jgi:ATP-dependent Clp protease adaptor protein ClpS